MNKYFQKKVLKKRAFFHCLVFDSIKPSVVPYFSFFLSSFQLLIKIGGWSQQWSDHFKHPQPFRHWVGVQVQVQQSIVKTNLCIFYFTFTFYQGNLNWTSFWTAPHSGWFQISSLLIQITMDPGSRRCTDRTRPSSSRCWSGTLSQGQELARWIIGWWSFLFLLSQCWWGRQIFC